jgi:hypothetical protein
MEFWKKEPASKILVYISYGLSQKSSCFKLIPSMMGPFKK